MSIQLLFVCSANQNRSPTAARLFARAPGLTCSSAGTLVASASTGGRVVSLNDIREADFVFAMEREHREQITARFGAACVPMIHVLGIEDIYNADSPQLVEELLRGVPPYLPVLIDVDTLRSQYAYRLAAGCW